MPPHVLASEIEDHDGPAHDRPAHDKLAHDEPAHGRPDHDSLGTSHSAEQHPQRFLVPIGRVLFSLIFIMAGFGHFSQQSIGYGAAAGVPLASIMVPLSGIIAFTGGLSIALGYKAKWGAWLLVLFLVPVTFSLHKFWAVSDPMMSQVHMAMFMKNLGLLGTALLVAHFGAGPISIDARRR